MLIVHRLGDFRPQADERPGTMIVNVDLLCILARWLGLVGRHAAENAGAYGDVLLAARIAGQDSMSLGYFPLLQQPSFVDEIEGGRALRAPVTSQATATVDALAATSGPLLAATRLLATELFHAFGSPEVRHITPDGRLRVLYFPDQPGLRAWAAQRGVELTEEDVAGE